MIGRIEERFTENDLDVIQNMEKILLASSVSSVSQDSLRQVANFYNLDLDDMRAEIRVQLISLNQNPVNRNFRKWVG